MDIVAYTKSGLRKTITAIVGVTSTMMTTKQYLLQIKYAESKVRRIRDQLDIVHAEMSALKSPAYDADRVQTSATSDKMLNLVIRYGELEQKLTEEVDALLTIRSQIISEIESLENDNQRDVLYLVYVKHLHWDDVASEMGYTRRWVEKLHGHALIEFKKKKSS